jgi:hypothetical protein
MEFPSASWTAQQAENRIQSPIEITQVDLFGMKNWNSMQVSILGFRLGMTRQDTLMVALKTGLRFDDDLGQACLKEKACNVFEGGRYNGVSLIYGEGEVLEKIQIEAQRRNASRQERSSWAVSKFQGATRQFVESYSDNLRNQILGSSDAMRAGKMTPPSVRGSNPSGLMPPAHREYQYSRLGLTLYLDLHDQTLSTDQAIEKLTIEFMRPKMLSK